MSDNYKNYVTHGTAMGSALSMILSYSINKSILWAIIHGLFSWFYVIYFALFKVQAIQ